MGRETSTDAGESTSPARARRTAHSAKEVAPLAGEGTAAETEDRRSTLVVLRKGSAQEVPSFTLSTLQPTEGSGQAFTAVHGPAISDGRLKTF